MPRYRRAYAELAASLRTWQLWTLLGWLDIRQRYARSVLGPFWITISMGIMVGSIAVVYGTLFKQDLKDYIPLIGMGFVIWGLISGVLNDACGAYTNNANYILQSDVRIWMYVLQVLWRQLVIFGHNFVIVLAILAVAGTPAPWMLPLFVPGMALLLLNLAWMAQLVALSSARFRDIPQLVAAVVQIAFYVTPLMWHPSMLGSRRWLVTINPFAALVDIVRTPLLGAAPAGISWILAGTLALGGWLLTMWAVGRWSERVPYWV